MYTSAIILTASLSLAGLASAAPTLLARQATTEFGTCGSPEIVFKDGLDGRKETAFIAADQQSFPHGSALKIGVISSFICGQLETSCKAPAATVATCKTAEAAGNAQSGGASADAFNAAFGIPTTFAAEPEAADSADIPAGGAANAAQTASSVEGNAAAASGACSLVAVTEEATTAVEAATQVAGAAQTNTCPAPVMVTVTATAAAGTKVAAAGTAEISELAAGTAEASKATAAAANVANTAAPSAAATGQAGNGAAAGAAGGIDIGTCTNFAMVFAAGFDGRGAIKSFQPADTQSFAHTSALNPAIISEFMCDTFVNACGKSKSTQTACEGVKTKIDAELAAGTLQRDQTYADAWLSGLEAAFGLQSSG